MLRIIEDVPVKVGNVYIVLVIDVEEDHNIHVILGRPFMATSETIIYVKQGMLTINVREDKLGFYFPNDHDLFYAQNYYQNLNLIREMPTWGRPKKKEMEKYEIREEVGLVYELSKRKKKNGCMNWMKRIGWGPKLEKGNSRDPSLKMEPF